VKAFRLGAVAFLQKQSLSESVLLDAVHQAVIRDGAQRGTHQRRLDTLRRVNELSTEEKSVLELVLKGQDEGVIAAVLGISRDDVERHLAKVMSALGAATLPALIDLAASAGLLSNTDSPGA
jgi:two-component system response regulator FixJ